MPFDVSRGRCGINWGSLGAPLPGGIPFKRSEIWPIAFSHTLKERWLSGASHFGSFWGAWTVSFMCVDVLRGFL